MDTLDEAALDAYLERWIQRQLGRRLWPWFQGTVTHVQGATPPYQVAVQRTGELAADGNVYQVLTPMYRPQVGDTVDAMWRDDATAYVVAAVAGNGAGTAWTKAQVRGSWSLTGPRPNTDNSFAVGRGDSVVVILWSLSYFVTTAGQFHNARLMVDGSQVDTSGFYFNTANVHSTVPSQHSVLGGSQPGVLAALSAGSHTFHFDLDGAAASSDANDRGNALVVELPA